MCSPEARRLTQFSFALQVWIQEDARRVREALVLVKTQGWVETSVLQIMQQFCRLVESNFLPFGPILGYILQTQCRVGKHVYQLDDGNVTEHVLPHCEEADKKLLEIVGVGLALCFAETRAAYYMPHSCFCSDGLGLVRATRALVRFASAAQALRASRTWPRIMELSAQSSLRFSNCLAAHVGLSKVVAS